MSSLKALSYSQGMVLASLQVFVPVQRILPQISLGSTSLSCQKWPEWSYRVIVIMDEVPSPSYSACLAVPEFFFDDHTSLASLSWLS